jgi:hypothetical protein
MQIEQCKSIATKIVDGIRFFFFENVNQINVYNSKCHSYGSYYDIKSFLYYYKRDKEELNLTESLKRQLDKEYGSH